MYRYIRQLEMYREVIGERDTLILPNTLWIGPEPEARPRPRPKFPARNRIRTKKAPAGRLFQRRAGRCIPRYRADDRVEPEDTAGAAEPSFSGGPMKHGKQTEEHGGRRFVFKALAAALSLGLCCWLITGAYTVGQGEVAVLFRFGRLARDLVPAGLHYALPYPVHQYKKISLTRMTTVTVGRGLEGWFVTGDLNIIQAELTANYRIERPADYLTEAETPGLLVENALATALNRALSTRNVDEVLTTGKGEIESQVKRTAQTFLDQREVGVKILSARISRTAPPEAVAQGFKEVLNARSDMIRTVEEARTTSQSKLSRIRTEAYELTARANGLADHRIKIAMGKCDALTRLIDSPDSMALYDRLRIDTLRRVLPRAQKYIVPPETMKQLRMIQ